MNIKYYHEFLGMDGVLNRFEILDNTNNTPLLIECTNAPFVLDYINAEKLTPVQGSQATIHLISQTLFQFKDLHTDDMQAYMVKFYREGSLYWVGWLDSELYGETLSDYPPYPVEFSAADFNILERLKFRDGNDFVYEDIKPLITQIKRCLDKLGLPLGKIYIGCSTTLPGFIIPSSETILHNLYIQSSNFYDEDNEPMTCRQVIESILQPFGLMMVQKNANVYIYDYNTLANNAPMKSYDFETMSFLSLTNVSFDSGEVLQKGTASTAGEYGYEEMINNTKITSSMYANNPMFDESIRVEELSEKDAAVTETDKYKMELYGKCEGIDSLNPTAGKFTVYTNKDSGSTLLGASIPYHLSGTLPIYRVKIKKDYLIGSDKQYFLNVKLNAYVNTRTNPFDESNDPDFSKNPYKTAKALRIYFNLYTEDESGNLIKSYANNSPFAQQRKWYSELQTAGLVLLFSHQDMDGGLVLNQWFTNSDRIYADHNVTIDGDKFPRIQEKDYGKGLNIPLPTDTPINGYVVFEVINRAIVESLDLESGNTLGIDIKNILINNISLSIADVDKEQAPTDDYEFKSYVNKKVAADYQDVTLNVISANEDQLPIGRANLLRRENGAYALQTSYKRAGQTDILERLLMCTIHSNYTTKNERFSVDINGCENPVMSTIGYTSVLPDKYLVTGCRIDFHNAKTTLDAVGFSKDTAQLSNIPYD